MQIDVVPTAEAVTAGRVADRTVLVIDVLRASTTIVTALDRGAHAVIPVADPESARAVAAGTPGAIIAGERRGEKIAGFDLGNSPVEFAAAPAAGRIVIFTTSNGTRALLACRSAGAVAIAAFVNLGAARDWALHARNDVTIVCAGERGAVSLEDQVCAGLLVDRLVARRVDAALTADAAEAQRVAKPFRDDISRLAEASAWARHLVLTGHGPDVAACLTLDTTSTIPVYTPGVDKVVSWPR
jgi:2-phosphosulfolactate phosphatase